MARIQILLWIASISIQVTAQVFYQSALGALPWRSLGLGSVYVGDFVVNGADGYISGAAEGPIFDQSAYGLLDAVLIKINVLNGSVLWVRKFGGSGDDLGAVGRFYDSTHYLQQGLAYIPGRDLIAMPFSFQSLQVLGVYKREDAGDSGLAIYSSNGTLMKALGNFPMHKNGVFLKSFHTDLIYDQQRQSLLMSYIQYYVNDSIGYGHLVQVSPFNYSVELKTNSSMEFRTLLMVKDTLFIGGHYADFDRNLSNISFVGFDILSMTQLYSSIASSSRRDQVSRIIYNYKMDVIMFSGIGRSPEILSTSNPSVGAFILGRWDYKNNHISIVTRFGANMEYLADVSTGVYWNETLDQYYVYGFDADQDQVSTNVKSLLIVYSANFTQLQMVPITEFPFSYVASIKYPYVLISSAGLPVPQLGVGPHILQLYNDSAKATQVLSSTTSTSTSSVTRTSTSTSTVTRTSTSTTTSSQFLTSTQPSSTVTITSTTWQMASSMATSSAVHTSLNGASSLIFNSSQSFLVQTASSSTANLLMQNSTFRGVSSSTPTLMGLVSSMTSNQMDTSTLTLTSLLQTMKPLTTIQSTTDRLSLVFFNSVSNLRPGSSSSSSTTSNFLDVVDQSQANQVSGSLISIIASAIAAFVFICTIVVLFMVHKRRRQMHAQKVLMQQQTSHTCLQVVHQTIPLYQTTVTPAQQQGRQ
ncbi:hypothetical protein MIR68_006059 [Amoeboaphelidium protococcarum]|nr:hypothetical protein MIR68_006059 [Amoeboaphelidium protococcarum]